MNFTSLYHRHLNASDEYLTLENEFSNVKNDQKELYRYLVSKYTLTKQKLHIEEIKICFNVQDNSSVH